MRRAVNNLALSLSEIPIKSFVRETDAEPVSEEKSNKFDLGFNGDEAKLSYEEIISLESQKKSLPLCNNDKSRKSESKKEVATDYCDESLVSVNKLFKTIELGDKEFVIKYFDSGNVNVTDQFGWTPLMSAACSGHVEIVDILLKLGACVNAQDKSGLTALDLASKKNHVEIVNLIKQNSRRQKKKSKVKQRDEIPDAKPSKNEIEKEKLYCDVCKIYFTESSVAKHEFSTLHVFNTNPKVKNACYGIPQCNRGYQMLLNLGWNEEGGLGSSGEGQKYPVKTVLKRDRKGLGESKQKVAKVTHFDARDTNAVKSVHRKRRKGLVRREKQKQLSIEAAKSRALRKLLSD